MARTPKKIMKVEPAKDYKKPLYAIGCVAAIAASSLALTGCENPMDSITDSFTTPGLMVLDIDESYGGHKQDVNSATDIPADGPDEVNETT